MPWVRVCDNDLIVCDIENKDIVVMLLCRIWSDRTFKPAPDEGYPQFILPLKLGKTLVVRHDEFQANAGSNLLKFVQIEAMLCKYKPCDVPCLAYAKPLFTKDVLDLIVVLGNAPKSRRSSS